MALPLNNRPTTDVIVITLTFVIAFVVVVSMIAVVYTALSPEHEANAAEVAVAVKDLTGSLIAMIVGYVGGRGAAGGGGGGGSPPEE